MSPNCTELESTLQFLDDHNLIDIIIGLAEKIGEDKVFEVVAEKVTEAIEVDPDEIFDDVISIKENLAYASVDEMHSELSNRFRKEISMLYAAKRYDDIRQFLCEIVVGLRTREGNIPEDVQRTADYCADSIEALVKEKGVENLTISKRAE